MTKKLQKNLAAVYLGRASQAKQKEKLGEKAYNLLQRKRAKKRWDTKRAEK